MQKKSKISISFFLFALFISYILFGVIFELFFEKHSLFSLIDIGRSLNLVYHIGEVLMVFLALSYIYSYFKRYKDSFLFAFLFLIVTFAVHTLELILLLINPVGIKNYFYLNELNGIQSYTEAGIYAHPVTLIFSYGMLFCMMGVVGYFLWRDWKKVQ
jgi:hypothetical protein